MKTALTCLAVTMLLACEEPPAPPATTPSASATAQPTSAPTASALTASAPNKAAIEAIAKREVATREPWAKDPAVLDNATVLVTGGDPNWIANVFPPAEARAPRHALIHINRDGTIKHYGYGW